MVKGSREFYPLVYDMVFSQLSRKYPNEDSDFLRFKAHEVAQSLVDLEPDLKKEQLDSNDTQEIPVVAPNPTTRELSPQRT